MMVVFTSRSEKKSLYTVRNILDNFADRIGTDTWKSNITLDGLETIQTLLRKNATKNTAVACHWIRSRNYSELIWIVGNRNKFNSTGIIPICTTEKNLSHSEWESDWQYLPEIKCIVGLAGLLHDWGKTSDFFQKKLRIQSKIGDPFRHEWVSCKILEAIVITSNDFKNDSTWLQLLFSNDIKENEIIKIVYQNRNKEKLCQLPPVATYISWLIMSHHKLPLSPEWSNYQDLKKASFEQMFSSVSASWGYTHKSIQNNPKDIDKCFTFSKGIMWEKDSLWKRQVIKWAKKLSEQEPILTSLYKNDIQVIRSILYYSRLSLMLGDYYVSSQCKETYSQCVNLELWANTTAIKGEYKQYLEEHLIKVAKQSIGIVYQLPKIVNDLRKTYDLKELKKKSTPGSLFYWQDVVVNKIKSYQQNAGTTEVSYFVVNMASTGCGKTFANVKIMKALSEDEGLRFVLALGLRSLTLQTGDEYRKRIKISKNDLAVLIGSDLIKKLHEINNKEDEENNDEKDVTDDRSLGILNDSLLPETLTYITDWNEKEQKFLDIFFKENQSEKNNKNKAFLLKPILVTTIDHIMGAIETIKGGRYLLPFLRLMSSDLIIDEIDDFNQNDLVAISRLVHLCGMLGRNVIISSATIPPDLAEGLYKAYSEGLKIYNQCFANKKICCNILCDEFNASIIDNRDQQTYKQHHDKFIDKRVKKLEKALVRRKANIVDTNVISPMGKADATEQYFSSILNFIMKIHDDNHVIDAKTGKSISIGVIRMANINPCVRLTRYLLRMPLSENYDIKVMAYHSKQTLLLRNFQEQYLDAILKRKYLISKKANFEDSILRQHIDSSNKDNIIFVLVATPVEEVGRDHDFDWAIIEPSSFRSIVQMAGRVLRHRILEKSIDRSNVYILEYNLKGLLGMLSKKDKYVFTNPGFESRKYKLNSHNCQILLKDSNVEKIIDAKPRILKNKTLRPKDRLIDLEQKVMEDFNDSLAIGPGSLFGWIQEYWWLTGCAQCLKRFRQSKYEEVNISLVSNTTEAVFKIFNGKEFSPCEETFNIKRCQLSEIELTNLWIKRDFTQNVISMLQNLGKEINDENMLDFSEKYGIISVPDTNQKWLYSDQLGLFKNEEGDI